jgi:pyruvate formate lyase activating enzyme
VHDSAGGSTYCPSCDKALIERDWYRIDAYHVRQDGSCEFCGTPIHGRFGRFERPFGPRRIPVRLAA